MKRAIIQKLLLFYPAKWRNEYGVELEDLLNRKPLQPTVVLDVILNALWQQLRFSNHSAGGLMTAGVGWVFVLSVILSAPLWTLIALPMRDARLIQLKPFEMFAILWLKLPLLITVFTGYPLILCLARVKLATSWTARRKRSVTAFMICSGCLFFLSGVAAFVAWQYRVVLTLRGIEPLGLISTTTVSACFARFAGSALEIGILLQIPVLAVLVPRMRSATRDM